MVDAWINEDGQIEFWDPEAPNPLSLDEEGAARKPATTEERISALEALVVKLTLKLRRLGE